jgi:peptide deformylase
LAKSWIDLAQEDTKKSLQLDSNESLFDLSRLSELSDSNFIFESDFLMALLKIYTFPDPVLAQKAAPITRIEERHHKLAEDMLETMYDAPGIGLAANQVGVLERMIVIDVSYEMEELNDGDHLSDLESKAIQSQTPQIHGKKPIVMINPEILESSGRISMSEGCLSVPDYTAEVNRSRKVTVSYLNLEGKRETLEADELLAVCIQHEIDHLNGTLFIDHLSPIKQDLVKKKLIAGKVPVSSSKKAGLL